MLHTAHRAFVGLVFPLTLFLIVTTSAKERLFAAPAEPNAAPAGSRMYCDLIRPEGLPAVVGLPAGLPAPASAGKVAGAGLLHCLALRK